MKIPESCPTPSLTVRPVDWHNLIQHGCWTAQGERGAGQHPACGASWIWIWSHFEIYQILVNPMDTTRQKSQKKDAEHDASLAPSDPNHVAKWGGVFNSTGSWSHQLVAGRWVRFSNWPESGLETWLILHAWLLRQLQNPKYTISEGVDTGIQYMLVYNVGGHWQECQLDLVDFGTQRAANMSAEISGQNILTT